MKKCLSATTLKLIALIAMTIDHVAWILFPSPYTEVLPIMMHIIGRISCPIMCYFVAEGYHYSRNLNRYVARLFVFALISHFTFLFAWRSFVDWKSFIPFYYGRIHTQTGILWPLAWGLVMLRIVHSTRIPNRGIRALLLVLICLICLPGDWSSTACLWVLCFGLHRGHFGKQMFWMVVCLIPYAIARMFLPEVSYGVVQLCAVLAIPLLAMYNGQKGGTPALNPLLKWGFYVYYPLHLFLLGILRQFI